eukprot:1158619-Pelagomonas_calceolata.AAC.4
MRHYLLRQSCMSPLIPFFPGSAQQSAHRISQAMLAEIMPPKDARKCKEGVGPDACHLQCTALNPFLSLLPSGHGCRIPSAWLVLCEEQNVPSVFALTRKKMGEIYGARKRVSAVALLELNGVDDLVGQVCLLSLFNVIMYCGCTVLRCYGPSSSINKHSAPFFSKLRLKLQHQQFQCRAAFFAILQLQLQRQRVRCPHQ